MNDLPLEMYPFLTRKMLAFEHALKLQLRLTALGRTSGTLEIRGISREGTFTFKYILQPDGFSHTVTFNIPDIPIWISVVDAGGGLVQGNASVSLDLIVNGDRLLRFVSGYVYKGKDLSWPVQQGLDARAGGGAIISSTVGNPGAGAEISINAPALNVWRFIALRFTFTTDATVANRRPHVKFTTNVPTIFAETWSSIDQAAGGARTYMVEEREAFVDEEDGGIIQIGMHDGILLPGGSTIKTITTNIQAGDQYSAISYMMEEYDN